MEPESFIDYEAFRMAKLIKNKKEYLAKLDPASMQYKHLLSEIEFLEQDILPMLLSKNMFLTDINKWIDKQLFDMANNHKTLCQRLNGVVFYYQLRQPTPIKFEKEKYTVPILKHGNVLAKEVYEYPVYDKMDFCAFISNDPNVNPPTDILYDLGKNKVWPEFTHIACFPINDLKNGRQ